LSAEAIRAHLYPEPLCALGSFLARRRLVSAMIDVSDGLSTDLAHLCAASGVGAWIGEELIPKALASDFDRKAKWDPVDLALHGGEDYQLLFTVPHRRAAGLVHRHHGVPLTCIGEIQKSKDLVLVRRDGRTEELRPGGWDHFRNLRD
jgi:thiamine-monophosphate kinase